MYIREWGKYWGRITSNTLLMHAKNGHEGTVQILLKRGHVYTNRPDIYDKRLLSCTLKIKNGQNGVVKMIVERDDVN